MDGISEWLVINKYWFLSGLGVAVPIAVAGWWINKRRFGFNNVQHGGDGTTNVIAGGNVSIHSGDNEETQRILQLKNLSDFRQTIYKAAYDSEEYMEKANKYGESGDIEKGREAFFKSAGSQREIITAYKINKHLFTSDEQVKIESEISLAEDNGEDAVLHLVKAIQLIHAFTESKIPA